MQEQVVSLAQKAHTQHWRLSGDEGTGDRLAKLVTDTWQSALLQADPDRFQIEVPVDAALRERIDVVDVLDGVAYELKVSPNNAHFEFYRDVFKVMVAKDRRLPQIARFVFLAPSSAAEKLMRNLGRAVVDAGPRLGLDIEIVGL